MDFLYQAKNQSGELIEGKIEAASEDQAIGVLHQRNLVVLSLAERGKDVFKKDVLAIFNRPSKKDIVVFTRQLSTLVEADVPLIEGLRTLERQAEKESFRKIIADVSNSIEGGASLSLALTEHKKIFGDFYVSLVRAGEISGKLQTTLSYLADYLERSASLNSKIRGALAYPIFVLSALVVVTIILMTVVVPQLLVILKEAGIKDLPISTRILIASSDFLSKYIILILIFFAAAAFGSVSYFKTPQGRMKFDAFKIKIPQFGKVIQGFYIARVAETLSTLIKAGVPILEGLTITSDVVGNVVYKNILLEAKENVRGGGSISEVLERYRAFPPLVPSMLAIGEKTGRTDFVLENLFKFYKTESENSIQNLSQLLEPVLILLLGAGVGILISAILLPIYSLVGGG